jgi:hypothetical protein
MTEYRIHDPEKGIIGPIRIDTVRDLIAAGIVHDKMLVSRDDGPFIPAAALTEILPLLKKIESASEPQPTYSGDLGKNTFFKVFHRFHVIRANGLLRLEREDVRRDVFLEDGQPTFVASNLESERFGEFLVARGKLERDDLEVALEAMTTDQNRLGVTLVRLGLVEPQDLYVQLRNQQMVRLIDLCTWEWGCYLFYDGTKYNGDKVDLQLVVPELIIQAARAFPLPRLEARLTPFHDAVIERLPHQVVSTDALRLNAFELRAASSIDGKRTLAQVLQALGTDPERRRAAMMVIYLLWEIDAVTFRTA